MLPSRHCRARRRRPGVLVLRRIHARRGAEAEVEPVKTHGAHLARAHRRRLLLRQRNAVEFRLNGQRRGHGRLWRRPTRAPEAVAGRPEGRPLPGTELRHYRDCTLTMLLSLATDGGLAHARRDVEVAGAQVGEQRTEGLAVAVDEELVALVRRLMPHDGAEEVQALAAALGQSADRGFEPLAAHVETDAARGGRGAAATVHRCASRGVWRMSWRMPWPRVPRNAFAVRLSGSSQTCKFGLPKRVVSYVREAQAPSPTHINVMRERASRGK
eukprot:scaffold5828_cov57-Phaeocystis_antarctica.AAC.1